MNCWTCSIHLAVICFRQQENWSESCAVFFRSNTKIVHFIALGEWTYIWVSYFDGALRRSDRLCGLVVAAPEPLELDKWKFVRKKGEKYNYKFCMRCYAQTRGRCWTLAVCQIDVSKRFKETCETQSLSYITTYGQLASSSWCQAPVWGPWPILLTILRQLQVYWCWDALFDERAGL
jgi:hypothetical protein